MFNATNLKQIDFDTPPVFNSISKPDGMTEDQWISWFNTFYQTLITYLGENGILLPRLSQAQIDVIKNPQNGQMIYNLTADTAQYYKISSGTWVTF